MRELKEQYNAELTSYNIARRWLEEVKDGTRKTSDLNFAEAELKLKRFMINLELIRIEMEKKGCMVSDKEVVEGFNLQAEDVIKNQIKLEV